jgi:hypothetical protein
MIEGISMYSKLFPYLPLSFPDGILKMKDPDDKRDPHLTMMTFDAFLYHFSEDIKELLDVEEDIQLFTSHNNHEILLLVDMTDEKHSMTNDKRRMYNKSAGTSRREKMREQYYYHYIFPRIHGYMFIQSIDVGKGSGLEHLSIISLDVITSSIRSNRIGVGTYMIKCLILLAKYFRYSDIVLEASNDEVSGECIEYTQSYPEEISDEDFCIEQNEDLKDVLTGVLWKMGMRMVETISHRTNEKIMIPYYNVDKEYICDFIEEYIYGVTIYKKYGLLNKTDYQIKTHSSEDDEPDENEYDGYWYHVGLRKSDKLINFYKKMGFELAPYVNTQWKMFSPIPYPSMRYIISPPTKLCG